MLLFYIYVVPNSRIYFFFSVRQSFRMNRQIARNRQKQASRRKPRKYKPKTKVKLKIALSKLAQDLRNTLEIGRGKGKDLSVKESKMLLITFEKAYSELMSQADLNGFQEWFIHALGKGGNCAKANEIVRKF